MEVNNTNTNTTNDASTSNIAATSDDDPIRSNPSDDDDDDDDDGKTDNNKDPPVTANPSNRVTENVANVMTDNPTSVQLIAPKPSLFASATPALPQKKGNFPDDPIETDVLLGRGKGFYNHPGNRHLQFLVEKYFEAYDNAATQGKTPVAHDVIGDVRNQKPNGRFMKYDKSTRSWHEVGTEEALRKVKQDFTNLKVIKKRKCEAEHPSLARKPKQGKQQQKQQLQQQQRKQKQKQPSKSLGDNAAINSLLSFASTANTEELIKALHDIWNVTQSAQCQDGSFLTMQERLVQIRHVAGMTLGKKEVDEIGGATRKAPPKTATSKEVTKRIKLDHSNDDANKKPPLKPAIAHSNSGTDGPETKIEPENASDGGDQTQATSSETVKRGAPTHPPVDKNQII